MGFHTFVICAYGQSPYLEACIRSLKAQTVSSEILCVTSTPSRWLSELLNRYQIPLYVGEEGRGIGHDWNFALETGKGTYVTIAHQDDLYGRHYVEELVRAAKKWPDMTVFMTDAVLIKNGKPEMGGAVEIVKKLLRLPWRFPGLCHLKAVKYSGLVLGNPVMCPSCSYRREERLFPMFSEKYDFVVDWDCMRRLSRVEGRFVCVEKPLLYYRIHEGAATRACMKNHRREKEELEMFEKIWPVWMSRVIMKVYSLAGKNYE